MLQISGLTKTYAGGIQALRGVDLAVPSGMFGLLGPNGSGKTTLMKIVATLLEPDSGHVEMQGIDLLNGKDKARKMLGYHIVSDVSNLCSHMAIIRKGRILASCEPQQAIEQLKESVWEATVRPENLPAIKSRYKVISSQMFGGLPRVRVISKGERPSEEFTTATPTLEDYYLSVVSETHKVGPSPR